MIDELLVEVTRGAHVESTHRGGAVAVDADGTVVFAAGDIDEPVYPRSAVKAMLALPLVQGGGADRLGLSDDEIALTCASHTGEDIHVAAATSMLRKAGRDETCLECGVHWPSNEAASHALSAAGRKPSPLHNNCSGKHSGFICLACDMGIDPAGYVRHDHPAMREVTASLADITAAKLDDSNRAVDGCSIPTFAIPLRALAYGFARFGTGRGMSAPRAAAAKRIRDVVAANPIMVSGTGRFDFRLMSALGARVFSKGGAEGVHCATIPALGIGVAVKSRDGAGRAADVAMAAMIARLLPDARQAEGFAALLNPPLKNWNQMIVGGLRPAGALAV
jgi:L-asparaginase II